MDKLKLPYCWEGIPATTQSALLGLMSVKRKHVPDSVKERLWELAKGMCGICGGTLDNTAQIDHKVPLCEAVDNTVNDVSNLRYLCTTCHTEVSGHLRRPTNVLLSHFNPKTYDDFVKSPMSKPFVQKFNKIDERRPIMSVDIRACRRNALTESELPWSIFCALDEFEPITDTLYDFNFVDAGSVRTAAKQLRKLPYQGKRWYSRQATQWFLK